MVIPVSVIIVTYNSSRFIGTTLERLDLDSSLIEVVVVDNASSDSTTDIVAKFDRAELTVNSENVGFARAVNQALSRIPELNFVLLLNPDATISGEHVQGLLRGFMDDPARGICAPLVRQSQGRMRVMHAGRFPTAWRMLMHQTGLSNLARLHSCFLGHYYHLGTLKEGEVLDADWVSGGCMMISPRVRSQVPCLDETWFMYAEDIHYCWAAKQAGFSVKIDTNFSATHEVGGSQEAGSEPSSTWLLNLYAFYRRDLSRNSAGARVWRGSVKWGSRLRAIGYLVYSMKHQKSCGDEASLYWRRKARSFFAFAQALDDERADARA